jgi:hypothetical protein
VWPEFFALSCEKEEYATFSGQNRISLPSQSTAPEESLASLQERLFACGKFLFTKETLDK